MRNNYQFNEADTIQNLAHHIDIHNYYVEKNSPKQNINFKGVVLHKKMNEFVIFLGIYLTFAFTFGLMFTKNLYLFINKFIKLSDAFLPIIYIIVLVSFIPILILIMEKLRKKNQIEIFEDTFKIEKGKYGKFNYSNIFNWRIDDKKRNRVILNIKNPDKNIVFDRRIDFSSEAEAIIFSEILKDKILGEDK
ncbi:hypothetical protein JCM11957_07150 [Caminibacter profundus]